QRYSVYQGSVRFSMPYCRTHALSSGAPNARRAIIVIMSSSMDSRGVYDSMVRAARDVSEDISGSDATTVIYSPSFAQPDDISAFGLASDVPVWTDYAAGANSISAGGTTRRTLVTSYRAVDEL